MKTRSESKQVARGPLNVCELDYALLSIYRSVQQQTFTKIFSALTSHEDPAGSRKAVFEEDLRKCENLRRLQALSLFVTGGLLRVGGRLRNAALSYEARHPVLLPCNHPVTDLVIRHHHHKEGHMGVNHVLAAINYYYYYAYELMLGLHVFRQTGPPRRVDCSAPPSVCHIKTEASR